MQQEQTNSNIILYACEGETHLGYDPFVYEHFIALLLRNPALKDFLFDFNEPHKIDLEAYMKRHFSYNVPLAQFAKLTGRSLSTFKRDFGKIQHNTRKMVTKATVRTSTFSYHTKEQTSV